MTRRCQTPDVPVTNPPAAVPSAGRDAGVPSAPRYRFGEFTLDPASYRLQRGEAEVALTPKAFEILVLLVQQRHRGLTKSEIFNGVWPDTAVTENTLTQRIKEIREALGDTAQAPLYLRTIPRVGFQFVGDVTEQREDGAAFAEPAPARRLASLATVLVAAILGAGLLGVVILSELAPLGWVDRIPSTPGLHI